MQARDAVADPVDDIADTEMARVLAVALAIGAHAPLRETLYGLAGAAPGVAFAVSQPDIDVWLSVEGTVVSSPPPRTRRTGPCPTR